MIPSIGLYSIIKQAYGVSALNLFLQYGATATAGVIARLQRQNVDELNSYTP
jgi:hypothetical protein